MSLRVAGLTLLLSTGAFAQASPDARQSFGAVLAPAALPQGATTMYAYLGAPEVGAGYRQGFGKVEFEGRASFDYLVLSIAAEAILRQSVYQQGITELAPMVGVGVVLNSGSRYFDTANFSYLALRPRVGLLSTWRIAETVKALALVELPWDIPLQPAQGMRLRPLAGAGLEVFLGRELTGLAMAEAGLDVMREPLGVAQLRVGWQVKLGLGWRLF